MRAKGAIKAGVRLADKISGLTGIQGKSPGWTFLQDLGGQEGDSVMTPIPIQNFLDRRRRNPEIIGQALDLRMQKGHVGVSPPNLARLGIRGIDGAGQVRKDGMDFEAVDGIGLSYPVEDRLLDRIPVRPIGCCDGSRLDPRL